MCFHRVVPEEKKSPLSIPRDLEVSAEFFSRYVEHFQSLGYRFISIEELPGFLKSSDSGPVMVLTFDDGYKDNLDHALPICEHLGVPMAVYVTTGLIDGTVDPWWYSLQSWIMKSDFVLTGNGGEMEKIETGSNEEKEKAYQWIYQKIREAGAGGLDVVEQIWQANHLHGAPDNDDLMMTWNDLRTLNDSPLVTIGAHTVTHPRLIWCEHSEIKSEISESKNRLQEELAGEIVHMAYPNGSENDIPRGISDIVSAAGYETAMAGFPRNIEPGDEELLYTLPRKGVSDLAANLIEVECAITGVSNLLDSRFRERLRAVKGFK